MQLHGERKGLADVEPRLGYRYDAASLLNTFGMVENGEKGLPNHSYSAFIQVSKLSSNFFLLTEVVINFHQGAILVLFLSFYVFGPNL